MASIQIVAERCLGCGACRNICDNAAITMQTNREGFSYPVADSEKCTGCGRCLRVCPLSEKAFRPETGVQKCYAVQSSPDIMKHSSSGGMFTVLADYVLERKGCVCGAAFDEAWGVEHRVISEKKDLYALQTSKYVQSDTKFVYKEIRDLLKSGRMVLFSGTPCQTAGLWSFLGRDYDTLVTIDIFCHGVPSPGVWKRYLKETGIKGISGINFRNKAEHGWNRYDMQIAAGKGAGINEPHSDNIYMLGFLRNLYLRKSCHYCPFANAQRTGDFSLGDFWGYEALDDSTDTWQGMSAVLVNTPKAARIFESLKSGLSFLRETELADVSRKNIVLRKPGGSHPNREAFFKGFDADASVIARIKNHLASANPSAVQDIPADRRDVAILNFSSHSTKNYGASLVGYAMEKAIAKTGYRPHTVFFTTDPSFNGVTKPSPFQNFRQKFLHLTRVCTTKAELRSIVNDRCDRIIIGSDQIVRQPWHRDFVYYLDWADSDKVLTAYAASFGLPDLRMNTEQEAYARACLERFSSFSVREHSGAEIMKRHFGRDVPVVCDPTLLLDAEDYQEIIDEDNQRLVLPERDYVAYYFLDEKPAVLASFAKDYPLVDAYRDEKGRYRPFGQWLNIIRNARYVMTDSFHGSVFSIIYRRQFVVLTTKTRGNDRLDTLMKHIGTNRLVADRSSLTEEKLFSTPIDYDMVGQNIARVRKQGYDYLRQALAGPGLAERIARSVKNVFKKDKAGPVRGCRQA